MMKQVSNFLDRIAKSNITKKEIFNILFDSRGFGGEINTNHVFFQEVIVKFNASKAKAVISNQLPYETDSHYVDVALGRYMELGFSIKQFDKDLEIAKKDYAKTHHFIRPMIAERMRVGA